MLNKKYLGSASRMLQELFDGVNAEDKAEMKSIFENISPELQEKYRQEVQPEILKYISSTTEERLSTDQWSDRTYRLKLHYFSFIYMQRGYLLMRRLAAMPNKNGLRRVPAFFSVMAEDVRNKQFESTIFDIELSFEDFT